MPSEGACFHSHPFLWTSLQTTKALKWHQRSIAEDRYLSDPQSIYRQTTLLPALATGLVQGPPSMHWPFFAGSSLPAPYRAPGLGHLPTLTRCRRNNRTSGIPLSGPRSGQEEHVAWRLFYNRPATPLELPGTDWGSDPPLDRE